MGDTTEHIGGTIDLFCIKKLSLKWLEPKL